MLRGAMPHTGADQRALVRNQAKLAYDAVSAWIEERRMRKSEVALLLHSRIGQTFDAMVTGRTPSGTFVRVFAPR